MKNISAFRFSYLQFCSHVVAHQKSIVLDVQHICWLRQKPWNVGCHQTSLHPSPLGILSEQVFPQEQTGGSSVKLIIMKGMNEWTYTVCRRHHRVNTRSQSTSYGSFTHPETTDAERLFLVLDAAACTKIQDTRHSMMFFCVFLCLINQTDYSKHTAL